MWQLYCLPGRLITEIGYLFPGKNQLWASKRRRESGFAAFIFATAFWVIGGIYVVPLVIGHGLRPTRGSSTAKSLNGDQGVSPPAPLASFRNVEAAGVTIPTADRSTSRSAPAKRKPSIVFAPPREVVQPLPAPTNNQLQECSATITDHCLDR